ncbi:MAG TPA: hypothetical protein VGL53_19190 [Bryobacteraceae bacterium]|jgi:hypothetical protein
MAASIYRRLTGKRRVFLRYSQLFLGPDHLLLVRSNRFEERYQRFYFKDIQALVVTGIPSRTWMQSSLGILAAAMILLALTTIANPAWRILLGMFGVFPAIIAFADFIRGDRCGMIVKTPASNERLSAVSRMSTARTVLAVMKPLVEQAQHGEWMPEMIPVSGPPVMAPPERPVIPATRLLPGLFGLVTLDAAVFLIARLTHRDELLVVVINMIFAEIVLALTALRRRGDDPRWLLYALCGAVVVCGCIDMLSGVGLFGFFGYVTSEDQRSGTTNAPRFMQLSYVQTVMWWGLGWRAVIAAVAWAQLTLAPRPESITNPLDGGPPSQL